MTNHTKNIGIIEGDSGVTIINKPAPQTAIADTRSRAQKTITISAPAAILDIKPTQFWHNLEQTFDFKNFDLWEGALLAMTISSSYLVLDRYFPETEEGGKMLRAGGIGAVVLAIANGIDPTPKGLTLPVIIIALAVLTGYLMMKQGKSWNLFGLTRRNKKPTTNPNLSPSLLPCTTCGKDTKGKNFCVTCLNPRAACGNSNVEDTSNNEDNENDDPYGGLY